MRDSKLKKGTKVRLDAGLAHTSIVEVVCQTPKRLITTVKSKRGKWEVHTYRLSKIISDSSAEICPTEGTTSKDIEPRNHEDGPST